ncbi:MAG: tRNA pseudouridine(55) synthase TruB [Defluviitaleaceae bacterium]|nr:tRNA pseudouridine(55) synthase TruB [Defluviitaleaceae bacterium]
MKKENSAFCGVLNIRKEKGYTSHDVVAILKRVANSKAGHTGTLDPDAEGVLPICLGRATKFAEYFSASDKTYVAEIVLGITTNTGDISGEVLMRKDVLVDFEELKTVAESFKYENCGEYLQVPPMYSAVKIGGKKLYELARKGQIIERPPRPVKILDLAITSSEDKFFLEITCSKGTYVRSLCMDIGEKLGCGAVMGELMRTRSGEFSIENSFTLAEVKQAAENNKLGEMILPVEKLLPFPTVFVKPQGLARALNGNPLSINLIENLPAGEKKFWLKSPDDKLLTPRQSFALQNFATPLGKGVTPPSQANNLVGGVIIGLFALKSETLRSEVMF